MKSFRLVAAIFFCLCISFFSCQEEEPPFVKKELDHLSLFNIVKEMPEFQDYFQASVKAIDLILKKRQGITEEEFLWVKIIHDKFPTLKDFRAKASDRVLLRYQELTTINVREGDETTEALFETFLSTLQENYIYKIEDLTEVLFTFKEENILKKKWDRCMSGCFLSAATQQNSLFNDCMNSSLEELPCRNEADFAFRYFFRGCASVCPQDE